MSSIYGPMLYLRHVELLREAVLPSEAIRFICRW